LYIATTAKRDAAVQKTVREISAKRRGQGNFRSAFCSGTTSSTISRAISAGNGLSRVVAPSLHKPKHGTVVGVVEHQVTALGERDIATFQNQAAGRPENIDPKTLDDVVEAGGW
jgi:hypothetical protein